MFNCHKQYYEFTIQSVETPDGLSASMYGLDIGDRYDSLLLSSNSLLNKQYECMLDDAP